LHSSKANEYAFAGPGDCGVLTIRPALLRQQTAAYFCLFC